MAVIETCPASAAIFCRVVDNYGDIGICWRLGKQLHSEFGVRVTLWVDDLASFHRLCPEIDSRADVQCQAGVTVCHWRTQSGVFAAEEVAELVIEFFGCDIPDGYIASMATCTPQPVWLNLEGLSAEQWVEGCHTLSSPHPRLPLTKYFFFPGFTDKTGGLLHEASSQMERRKFQSEPQAVRAFLAKFGLTEQELASLKVSLFCYPHAPVMQLFEAWQRSSRSITCLVPEGVAVEAIRAFLGTDPKAGSTHTRGTLTVRVLPFVPQPDYDRLLWACDLNFVRGEDSFVRAQWANKPFVWHIYPQEKNLHHVKLRAFLQCYAAGTESWRATTLRWNDADAIDAGSPGRTLAGLGGACTEAAGTRGAVGHDTREVIRPAHECWTALWPRFLGDLSAIGSAAAGWERQMLVHGDLVSNLLAFAGSVRSGAEKSTV